MVADQPTNRIEMARSTLVRAASPSLLPLLFRRLDRGKPPLPPLRAFEPGSLTRTASAICKFSALLVQAYWLLAALRKRPVGTPKHLNQHLLQIWAGNQTFTEGSAISILQEAVQLNTLSDTQMV